MESQNEDQLIPIGIAARSLGISTQTLRDWCKRGIAECITTITGQRRFKKSEVERLLCRSCNEIFETLKKLKNICPSCGHNILISETIKVEEAREIHSIHEIVCNNCEKEIWKKGE